MLAYYFQLGLRSLRRNPVLTALMVMAIGIGVAASMITYSVFRAVSGNPIPDKSAQLFTPEIDGWGPQYNNKGQPQPLMNYTDAMALMHDRAAKRQTVLYSVGMSVLPEGSHTLPIAVRGFATYGDFFPMFEVPLRYGSGWSRADDDAHAAVVVLGEDLNQKLFAGANSVGRNVTLNGHDYRVVGVARHWNPKPRYFALWGGGFGDSADVYLPFTQAMDQRIDTASTNSCRGAVTYSSWDEWQHSNCVWIMAWVELDSASDVEQYHRYLEGYAAEQQHAGRYPWPPNIALRDVMQWLDHLQVVPPESRISLIVALGFFVICLVNTVGLLLAKFMRRAGEIGVRRALGASRREIYMQYLIEASSVGLAGGVLGVLLTAVGMSGVGLLFEPDIAQLAHLDVSLVGMTLLVAVLASMAAAFYPAWRAAQVQPAWQLKSN